MGRHGKLKVSWFEFYWIFNKFVYQIQGCENNADQISHSSFVIGQFKICEFCPKTKSWIGFVGFVRGWWRIFVRKWPQFRVRGGWLLGDCGAYWPGKQGPVVQWVTVASRRALPGRRQISRRHAAARTGSADCHRNTCFPIRCVGGQNDKMLEGARKRRALPRAAHFGGDGSAFCLRPSDSATRQW